MPPEPYIVATGEVPVKEGERIPTLREVARLADVSTATVSRVINGLDDGYADQTRQRVQQAIESLGYSPNIAARTMKTRRTGTIGVLLPDLSSMFTARILQGIETSASQAGLNVLVSHTESNGRRTMEYLRIMHEKRVDGLVFVSETLRPEYREFVSRHRMPLVLLSSEDPEGEYPSVKVSDRAATADGTRALIGLGHRNVFMVSGTRGDPVAGVPRVDGWREALLGEGLPADEDMVLYAAGFAYDGIPALAREIDAALGRADAFICASDELAAGLVNYLRDRGIEVPARVSVMGYDDLPVATMLRPSLSTIRQPLAEMGARAAAMVASMRADRPKPASEVFPHTVVLRESTRPAARPAS